MGPAQLPTKQPSLAIAAFGWLVPSAPRLLVGAICAAFAFGFVCFAWAIVRPAEWELVAEGDQLRWGRADSPDRQQRLAVSRLTRLVYFELDGHVLADVGGPRLLPVGPDILIRAEDRRAFVEHLRRSFPSLPIEA